MTPYRVLSIDGGGIRGILTARILERLEKALPGFLKEVDLFAGTSTGGLIALGLASGMTPTDLRKLYENSGSTIFADSFLHEVEDLGNLIGAKYPSAPLKHEVEKHFYGKTLADLPKKVLIAAFKLDNEGKGPGGVRMWKMKFFHNYPGEDSDGDQLVVDVAMRTSVAPAFFPTYQGYIDGGVAASNPAMCALAETLHPDTGKQKIENVNVLSIGTGFNPHYLPVENADWGLVQWAPHFLDMMLESDSDMVHFQMERVLEDQYYRLNPVLPKPIGMDGVQDMPALLTTADQCDLGDAIAWLKKNF